MSDNKKLILVIGATGAQGLAVIDKLLEPAADGSPSPYVIRALTRDPTSRRAQLLAAKGAELAKGSFNDFPSVLEALKGVYGAWVNTDGFTVGEAKELQAGMRIFELAKQLGTVRHYVWSNLDYSLKKGGYNPAYHVEHYDGKGRVGEWLRLQPSVVSDDDMSWSVVTSGPYMEMLNIATFGPIGQRKDGTFVFASPIGKGHVPMIALEDLGFWARYTFDHRAETSGRDVEIASDWVGWDYLVNTFTKVTGQKAVVAHQSLDEWFELFLRADHPIANERSYGDGSTTWRENFTGFWSQWRDNVIQRDFEWLRKIHPSGYTVESWMRAKEYKGLIFQEPSKKGETGKPASLLKNTEDDKAVLLNKEAIAQVLAKV